jgi:membrane-associated phospholipid phosphatase
MALGTGLFFLALTALVATQAAIRLEATVLRAVQSVTTEQLDSFAAAYTHLSSLETMLLIATPCGCLLFAAGWRWRALAPFGFMLTLPLEMAAKVLVAQPQVDPEYVRRAGNYILFWIGTAYSYPSSHASRAAFLACLIWVALVSVGPLRGRYWLAGAVALVVAVTLGLTRVYLGYHWPSDVLAGWALGLASFGLVAWLVTSRRTRRVTRPTPQG